MITYVVLFLMAIVIGIQAHRIACMSREIYSIRRRLHFASEQTIIFNNWLRETPTIVERLDKLEGKQ